MDERITDWLEQNHPGLYVGWYDTEVHVAGVWPREDVDNLSVIHDEILWAVMPMRMPDSIIDDVAAETALPDFPQETA